MTIDEILREASVIPVLEIARIEDARPLAEALSSGGLRVIELTMRTDCALEAIGEMQKAAPSLKIGMGTIRTADDVERSLNAGAAFLVSPGASFSLLGAFVKSGAAALPGVATASEAMAVCEAGFKVQKFFPAEAAGGIAYLKSLAGPLPDVRFCPTGGVSADKAQDYLALSNVACVGGSWIATKDMIAEGNWAAIEANAAQATAIGAGEPKRDAV